MTTLATDVLSPLHLVQPTDSSGSIRTCHVTLHAIQIVLLAALLQRPIGMRVLRAVPGGKGPGMACFAGIVAYEGCLPLLCGWTVLAVCLCPSKIEHSHISIVRLDD